MLLGVTSIQVDDADAVGIRIVARAKTRLRPRDSCSDQPSLLLRTASGRALRGGAFSAEEYRSDQRLSRQRNLASHRCVASDLLVTPKGGAWADIEDEQGKCTAAMVESCEELDLPTVVENAK
eukprot:5666371-Karenia_brevis.AAC.1